jgi:hypothetical protein
MVSEGRMYAAYNHQIMYHLILFGSFIASIFAIPYIKTVLPKYVQQPWAQQILPYCIAYILAIYMIPEIAFLVLKSSSDKQ